MRLDHQGWSEGRESQRNRLVVMTSDRGVPGSAAVEARWAAVGYRAHYSRPR